MRDMKRKTTEKQAQDEVAVAAHGLTRIYGSGETKVVGLADVDLVVSAGSFCVLKGESGSGKSTLLALLAGLDTPTSGSLEVAGQNLSEAGEGELLHFRRNKVGMIFQSFNLLPTLTVIENALLPAMLALRPMAEAERRAAELLERLGMSARLYHTPAMLSGGEMQRTAIARALINRPEIILADEPTGNLDSTHGQTVIDLLKGLRDETGVTVIVATHSDLADTAVDAVLHLKDGRLLPS